MKKFIGFLVIFWCSFSVCASPYNSNKTSRDTNNADYSIENQQNINKTTGLNMNGVQSSSNRRNDLLTVKQSWLRKHRYVLCAAVAAVIILGLYKNPTVMKFLKQWLWNKLFK